ncbi:MAG: YIP1 family protein [Deltaproteobacteria bacterium]|nr:YIP1 family protein [Deltaproteobacteria bacterium]
MEEKRGVEASYEFDTKNFINSFIGVAKTVLTKPNDFYQHMPTTGGFSRPVTFLAVCLGVSGIIAAIITGGSPLIFFKLLIIGLIFSFIGAGVLHFIAQKLFVGKGEFEGTYRVVAYAGAVDLLAVELLAWIPILGILAALYGFYLQVVGLEKVHRITSGQAVITILIALAIYLILSLLVGGFFFTMR